MKYWDPDVRIVNSLSVSALMRAMQDHAALLAVSTLAFALVSRLLMSPLKA